MVELVAGGMRTKGGGGGEVAGGRAGEGVVEGVALALTPPTAEILAELAAA